mmetsp:Transcript_8941/g.28386  ORF Transcript_8941/g.28386 Transcript_8941/m.28386 type:complete len:451 (+) Transcript_8941:113-1465(+)
MRQGHPGEGGRGPTSSRYSTVLDVGRRGSEGDLESELAVGTCRRGLGEASARTATIARADAARAKTGLDEARLGVAGRRRRGRSLAGFLVVVDEPLDGVLEGGAHGGEGEFWPEGAQLGVGGGLLVLAVGLGGVEDDVAFELHGLGDHEGDVLDGDLGGLVDREDDGLGGVVLVEDPDGEGGEVEGVDELAEGRARAPDGEVGAVALGDVALVDKTRDDVAPLDREVVVLAEDVRRDDRGELAPVLVGVAPVQDVDHALGVGVSLIRRVRRAVVDHRLVDRVRGLVGEDAGRQARDQLLDFVDPAALHHVVVDQHVLPIELHLLRHVREQPAHHRREVNHVRRLVLREDRLRRRAVAQVPVLRRQEHPRRLRLGRLARHELLDGHPVQPRPARHQHDAPRALSHACHSLNSSPLRPRSVSSRLLQREGCFLLQKLDDDDAFFKRLGHCGR